MNELLSDKLWLTISRLAKRAAAKRAAVAYVTSETFIKFGDGDTVVTDASDAAIAGGQTSAKVVARALRRGAKLYSLTGLHSKVLLLGGTAIIGSANLSESSSNAMIEAAWVTDNPAAVGMTTALIQQLAQQAAPIDDAFLKRILKIKVRKALRPRRGSRKLPRVRIPKHRTWIVGVKELVREFADEQTEIEKGTVAAKKSLARSSSDTSWIRWTGNSRFRSEAKKGDSVIEIWSENGSRRPTAVYRHAPIVHRQNEKTCTRFFVEEYKNAEDNSISWGRFKNLFKQLNLPGKIGPGSARPIAEAHANALFELWHT